MTKAFGWTKVASAKLSWVASLLILPFAHEDLAIVLGGFAIVNDLMPALSVVISIYVGMVVSDFALYGIGAGARHFPWLGDYAIDQRVRRFGDTLNRNIFGLVALCRLVPGVIFVAFVACGWTRVPFRRFTIASVIVSAFYLPLALYLVTVFGDAIDDHLGLWTWPLFLGAVVALGLARKRVFSFADSADHPTHVLADRIASEVPPRNDRECKLAWAERMPPILFYFPLALTWLGFALRHRSLTLPTAANPTITAGGMWGASKSSYFFDVAAAERRWIADFVVATRVGGGVTARGDLDRALHGLADAGIDFPIVAKPDIGWHGFGVRRINGVAALRDYLAGFPRGAKVILQRFVPHVGEAGVLYTRVPGEPHGRIVSLTFRHFPQVAGAGRANLRELIPADPRTHRKADLHIGAGALYRDANISVTPELEARFDAIARSMREFHYGRFAIRFESIEALLRGENFSIVEINGIGGEAIDVSSPDLSVREVYRHLIAQQRLLFQIGERNRARGFIPMPLADFVQHFIQQDRLIRQYPASA